MASLQNTVLFLGLITLIAVGTTQATPEVEFTADNANVRVGDNITLRCDVDGFAVGNVVEWYKVSSSDDSTFKLAVNKRPEDTTRASLPDFTFDLVQDVPVIHFITTIQNAKVEYSGRYRCRLQVDADTTIDTDLDVTVNSPPTEIELSINDEAITEDSSREFDGYGKLNVRCTAMNGNPAPMVHLFKGDMDISQMLEKTVEEVTYMTGDVATFDIPKGRTVLENSIDLASSFGHKDLYCKAHNEDSGAPEIVSHKYHIMFSGTPPAITCEVLDVVEPYSHNVLVNCSVEADPALSDMHVSFMNEHNQTHTMRDGDNLGRNLRFSATTDSKNQMKYQLVLHVERATPQMFRTYTFSATNDKGTETKEVTLVKDPNYSDPDSASMCTLSIATLVASLLAILLL